MNNIKIRKWYTIYFKTKYTAQKYVVSSYLFIYFNVVERTFMLIKAAFIWSKIW